MVFKVVRGNPTPEELAAAVTVVQARATAGSGAEESGRPLRRWADPARTAWPRMPHPGSGAWRSTFWSH